MSGRYLVVIPAYNEGQNIGSVLEDLRTQMPHLDRIVINDGSHDTTEAVVREMGEKVITLPYNLRYGAALQTGFKYALCHNYDHVIQFDGDGQHDAREIEKLMRARVEEGADLVIGSRFLDEAPYAMGFIRRTGVTLLRWLTWRLAGQRITDPTSGFQLLSRKVFAYYAQKDNFPRDFPDANVLIYMKRAGIKITEVPVRMKQRRRGKSMHSGWKVVIYVFKMLVSMLVASLRQTPDQLRDEP
ncbi:glycosyltransferase family 2 protein [Calderihabitans maritimus]|uniref:Cell wall biosynthesis glycosyltransferase n=1 Tax=Calderihabitans maritimus TaxID=1246530 RepID=A0A1Z5HVN9_9FIRM|nr:glycosyltransferase family 2 protein [Calderihabitans maritimus]GAW93407.1 cell wall biosynthesis glycosyltransferase [Calderihabitans maritimus]